MQIALFGGTFDPPHSGHLKVAKYVLQAIHPDEIWFIPNKQNPLKKTTPINNLNERINRLQKLTAAFPKMHVYPEPSELNSPVTTQELLKFWKNKYPHNKWFLIIGADQAVDFHKWAFPHEIVKIAKVIVCQRNNIDYQKLTNNIKKYNFELLTNPLFIESSTKQRTNLEWIINQNKCASLADFKYFELNKELSKHRLEHCCRTAQFGLEVAHKHNLSPVLTNQIGVACYLHDIAKEWTRSAMEKYLQKHNSAVLKRHFNLWHGFVGAHYIAEKYHINVVAIKKALENHTQPTLGMDVVGKVVYLADKLEIGRSYPGINHAREIVFQDIEKGFKQVVSLTWTFLEKKGVVLPEKEASVLRSLMK